MIGTVKKVWHRSSVSFHGKESQWQLLRIYNHNNKYVFARSTNTKIAKLKPTLTYNDETRLPPKRILNAT